MEKSIENIWTKGFLNSEELKAPKINDLYNRKSELLLEKLKKRYTIDNNSLLPLALIIGVVCCIFNYYLVAIYSLCVIISLFFFNKSILKSLENIQITTNSYDYLVTYKSKVQNIIKKTTHLLGFLFPLVMMPGYFLFLKNTVAYNKFVNDFTTLQILGILLAFATILGVIAIGIYRLTTKITYGSYLNQLNIIIKDMEELRA